MLASIQITGTSGFVGTNLVNYLESNGFQAITAVSRNALEATNFRVAGGSTAFIHLAGKAHDLKSASDPDEYYRANFEVTKKVYDAFLLSDARKFIFVSSVKAVADHLEEALTEHHVPSPQTPYGKSKLMAEEYIQAQRLPDGKSYYILRPCMIHGPGNKGNLNLLYHFVSKGVPYPLAAFGNKRSFLTVENLCFIIKEIVESNAVPSGIYNVADDEALSTSEVVSLLYQSLNKKPRFWHIPRTWVAGLAKIGDTLKLPLNSEGLCKLTENYVVVNERVKMALGKELPVSAREGLLRTAKSFRWDK